MLPHIHISLPCRCSWVFVTCSFLALTGKQGCQKVFKWQDDNEKLAELTPKAQVLEGEESRDISRGFHQVFSTVDAMLFCQNTLKTGNNAIEMSQAFHNITWFKRFTDPNLFKICVQCHSKLGNGCFKILFDGAFFCQQLWQKEIKVAS